MQVLATQVEESVLEPYFLWIFLIAEHRQGQFSGAPQHLDLADVDFDRTGRQLGVLGAGRARAHLTVDAHHPLRAQRLGDLERRAVWIGHHLGEPVMIAQIDEQDTAMVAHAMTPAGKARLAADVACSQCAAGMAAITVHFRLDSLAAAGSGWNAESACGNAFVKRAAACGILEASQFEIQKLLTGFSLPRCIG